jgi:hypothetical protein
MTELDFDREGFPYNRQLKARTIYPTDEFTRGNLLPLLYRLDTDKRSVFDDQIVRTYSPEAHACDSRAALEIIKRLPMEELVEVAETLQFLAE